LRKLLTVVVAATATLALAGGAVAQSDEITFKASVSPADAGTANKPKNTKLRFQQTLDKPGTTVEFIDLALPRSLKLSGKGLGDCTVDDLAFGGPPACANDKAGPTGHATATLGTGPSAQELVFNVTPFVASATTLLFYVASEEGSGVAVQSPITGKITAKGRKLRIRIPLELRQPVVGVDASLTSLDATFTAKKGKRYLVSSVGCKNRKHKFNAKLTFSERADGAPVPDPVSASATARCKK
jgi:hypothetical protein